MKLRLPPLECNARDLRALTLLDSGLTQAVVCERCGMSRGPLVRLLADIREDERAQR